eukprot:GHRR01008186.1.p1 GENE.GHRR01008186.1~~GHRR01008186.1.p1  ORF type:complete len:254 (+),score=83.31 GHRR01008186.1:1402-2163(+)
MPAKATASSATAASTGSISQAEWDVAKAGQSRPQDQPQRPDVAVVLVEPQIPQNTGNVARTCAATNVALHLVGPLGFELDDKKLKRAGLDYWHCVCVRVHDSWEAFYTRYLDLPSPKRLIGYSVYGDQYYAGPEFQYQPGDMLLFGAETTGLPLQAHRDIIDSGGVLVKIPIVDNFVRSLNQSVSVGVGVFEAIRQLDEGSHHVQPRDDANSLVVRLPTPMMLHHQQQQQVQDCQTQLQQSLVHQQQQPPFSD